MGESGLKNGVSNNYNYNAGNIVNIMCESFPFSVIGLNEFNYKFIQHSIDILSLSMGLDISIPIYERFDIPTEGIM